MRVLVRNLTSAMAGTWAILMLVFAGACGGAPGEKAAVGAQAEPAGGPETPPAGAEAAAAAPSTVIVTVEGTDLTQGEVDKQIMQMLASKGMRGVNPEQLAQFRPSLQKRIVQNFVANTVLRNEANRQEVDVPQEEVDEAMKELQTRIPPGASFEKLLEQAGMSLEELRTDVAESLRVRKLLEKQTEGELTVTEEEQKAYYEESKEQFRQPEQVAARHILLKVDGDADEALRAEKRKAADALRKQLVDGADFAELAKAESDCPSKSQGGSLGTFGRGRMVKEFEDAAFAQKVDDIGPVVETKFGYHIIQVTGHTDAEQKAYEDVADQIAKMLEDKKRKSLVQAYVAELEEAADITYPEQPADVRE